MPLQLLPAGFAVDAWSVGWVSASVFRQRRPPPPDAGGDKAGFYASGCYGGGLQQTIVSRKIKINIYNMKKLFVDNDFQAPYIVETDRIRLRMLTINDVVKDYDAVMSSIKHLQMTKPFGPLDDWPTQGLTFEQDLIDLGWHQKEFQKRSSFTYTVMTLDEIKCIGCLYIYPSPNSVYDAEIIMWIRENELYNGLDEYLFDFVRNWIQNKWPFNNPGYPGRIIEWNSWLKLK